MTAWSCADEAPESARYERPADSHGCRSAEDRPSDPADFSRDSPASRLQVDQPATQLRLLGADPPGPNPSIAPARSPRAGRSTRHRLERDPPGRLRPRCTSPAEVRARVDGYRVREAQYSGPTVPSSSVRTVPTSDGVRRPGPPLPSSQAMPCGAAPAESDQRLSSSIHW